MALKASLTGDEFASLPETIQEHYTPEGDGYRLDTDIVVEDVAGLKSALQKERERAKALAADVKKYKDIDPDKARADAALLEEIENRRLEEAGEFETLKSKLAQEKEDGINAVRTELGTKLSRTETKLRQVLIENAISSEAARQNAFPKSVGTFTELASKFVELEAADDDFIPKVKNGLGSSIEELVTNLRSTDEYGIFFQADVAAGGGSRPNTATPGDVNAANLKRSTMSDTEKAKYIRENGLKQRKGANPAYEELPFK